MSFEMKKLFISLAALAAVVGCSKVEEHNTNIDAKQRISLSASIEVEETRVTVEGEKFTEVAWEQEDAIRLVSVGGLDAELKANGAGKESVGFEGEGAFVAEVDTYYAVHPAQTIEGATVTFDYAEQSGSDVVALVAKGECMASNDLKLSFKPVNSLLHVAVSGAESLAKAEFSAFDGLAIASSFTYNFTDDSTVLGGSVEKLVIENPAAEGFFFSLPADLDMANGYVVTLTDAAGNVCSKAYNGKTFARGTTTRVEIAWSTPVVTLVAPKTSYSYYAEGNSSKANSCANNVIYFDGASTYANIQNAMVAEAGFIVDGTEYAATIDTATKSFTMGNVTVASWGAKSVEAYVKTKDGRTIKSAAETVYITGLPYSYNFEKSSLDNYSADGWTTNGKLRVSNEDLAGRTSTLVLHHRRYSKVLIVLFNEREKGYVVSPKFVTPSDIAVQPMVARSAYNAVGDQTRTGYVGPVANTSSSSSAISYTTLATNDLKETVYGSGEWMGSLIINNSVPYISVDCLDNNGNELGAYYFLHEVAFRYAE